MTHYLRLQDGTATVVDIEATSEDIRCVVDIEGYTAVLFHCQPEKWADVVRDFSAVQEIRGEWFETRPSGTTDDFAKKRLKALAEKYSLYYCTD